MRTERKVFKGIPISLLLQRSVEKGVQKQACWTTQRSVCKVIITRMHREACVGGIPNAM